MSRFYGIKLLRCACVLCTLVVLAGVSYAGNNEVLGEIHLKGATKVERDSGVWVDGQYLRLSQGAERNQEDTAAAGRTRDHGAPGWVQRFHPKSDG